MKLYEFMNKSSVEYIFVIAKNTKRAIKLANKNSDCVDPDYDEYDIISDDLEVDMSNKEGVYEKIIR
jgi:hypothetical protein